MPLGYGKPITYRRRIDIDLPRIQILRDYPNSMYFNGFDATVQAGGYNSFHETRTFGLPALFYSNMNTGMDDQIARCKVAETEKWGIVVEQRTQKTISVGIKKLLSMTKTKEQQYEPGSEILANLLLENKENY